MKDRAGGAAPYLCSWSPWRQNLVHQSCVHVHQVHLGSLSITSSLVALVLVCLVLQPFLSLMWILESDFCHCSLGIISWLFFLSFFLQLCSAYNSNLLALKCILRALSNCLFASPPHFLDCQGLARVEDLSLTLLAQHFIHANLCSHLKFPFLLNNQPLPSKCAFHLRPLHLCLVHPFWHTTRTHSHFV